MVVTVERLSRYPAFRELGLGGDVKRPCRLVAAVVAALALVPACGLGPDVALTGEVQESGAEAREFVWAAMEELPPLEMVVPILLADSGSYRGLGLIEGTDLGLAVVAGEQFNPSPGTEGHYSCVVTVFSPARRDEGGLVHGSGSHCYTTGRVYEPSLSHGEGQEYLLWTQLPERTVLVELAVPGGSYRQVPRERLSLMPVPFTDSGRIRALDGDGRELAFEAWHLGPNGTESSATP